MKKVLNSLSILALFSLSAYAGFDTSDHLVLQKKRWIQAGKGALIGGLSGVAAGAAIGAAGGALAASDDAAGEVDATVGGLFGGVSAGIAGTQTGMAYGVITGTNKGIVAIAEKYGISKNIVQVALSCNVSLSAYKKILIESEKGQKQTVRKMLASAYQNLFSMYKSNTKMNGLSKFKALLNEYNSMRDIRPFMTKVGSAIFEKFQDAVSLTAAVEALLTQKSLTGRALSFSVRANATNRLMLILF